jgi:hypothetical protein
MPEETSSACKTPGRSAVCRHMLCLITLNTAAIFFGQTSSSSHVLLRLRLLHPVAAVIGSLYVLWLLWNLQGKRDWSASRRVLGATLTVQIVLGLMNVILLAPVWLQMTHLFVAELFWILLVLASAELLLVEQQWSGLARERTSEVTWGALKHMPRMRSSFMKIFKDDQKETLRAR